MNKNQKKFNWMPVSDVMSGLMILFLFIAISFMKVQQNQAATYSRDTENLYIILAENLKPLLEQGTISINEENLAITFIDENTVYFQQNRAIIQPSFQKQLDVFIPIFVETLQKWDRENPKKIIEIRVEGHTSSVWTRFTSKEDSYYNNMQLSQDRAREVVKFLMEHYKDTETWDWLMKYVTANGLSSSKLIYHENTQTENRQKSMRVEFQVRLDSVEILKSLSGDSI